MSNPTEVTSYELTEGERLGAITSRAAVMQAKARLCDAQHALQQAQEAVEAAQKTVAMAESRREGAELQIAYSKGATVGSWAVTEDGSKIVRS